MPLNLKAMKYMTVEEALEAEALFAAKADELKIERDRLRSEIVPLQARKDYMEGVVDGFIERVAELSGGDLVTWQSENLHGLVRFFGEYLDEAREVLEAVRTTEIEASLGCRKATIRGLRYREHAELIKWRKIQADARVARTIAA